MSKPPNLFPLKLIVISLGFLLIGGTIWVFAAIASKTGKGLASVHSACHDATLHLPPKTTVTGITPEGDTIQITLADSTQTEVITVDRCSGSILQTLTISHD